MVLTIATISGGHFFWPIIPLFFDVTQSVLDLTKAQNVVNTLNAFGASLSTHHIEEQNLIQSARDGDQSAQKSF